MRISDWSSDVCSSDLLSSFVPGDPIPQDFVEAAEAVQAVMYEIVEQRRANPGPDLISTLITAYEEGEKLNDAALFGKRSSIVIGSDANRGSGRQYVEIGGIAVAKQKTKKKQYTKQ